MAKSKKQITIRQSFLLSYFIPGAILLILLLGAMGLLIAYGKTQNRIVLIVSVSYVLVLSALYAGTAIFMYFKMKQIYYKGLYRTTSTLLRGFKNNIASDESYPKTNIVEINDLNKDLHDVNTIIGNSTMITADLENSYIPLVFISEEERIVTLDSFKSELRSLIYCSQNFRNVIVEIFYDLEEDTLTKEESKRLVSVISESLGDYQHFIFAPNNNGTGFYLYLPRTDSFSHIQERLISAMKNLSITKKTFDGLATINARFSIVCYPYSNIDELFPDLDFAKRQGKVLYLYLPNRLSALRDNRIVQNALNLNNLS